MVNIIITIIIQTIGILGIAYLLFIIYKVNNDMEKMKSQEDKVNHPDHYCQHPSGIECIDVTRHYCFSIGNAIKYLWRAGLKSEEGMSNKEKEIQDLEKAIWYINDRIKQLKEK